MQEIGEIHGIIRFALQQIAQVQPVAARRVGRTVEVLHGVRCRCASNAAVCKFPAEYIRAQTADEQIVARPADQHILGSGEQPLQRGTAARLRCLRASSSTISWYCDAEPDRWP